MTVLHRLLCVGCAIAALAFNTQAQSPSKSDPIPSENTLETWLSSGDPRLEAWGAHDALVTRDQDLIPYLLSLASRWQPLIPQPSDNAPPSELRLGMAAVLDTLIQMNAPVPADTLRTLAPDFGNDVGILLGRLPNEESSPLSFDFYHSPPEHGDALQSVSAALLALHPPSGFAADLLSSIRVHATLVVVLPGSNESGLGGGSSCGLGGTAPPRENWPVTGQYFLSKQKRDGASLVVGGIDPIYAIREQSTYYLGDTFCTTSTGVHLGPNERLRLIAEMLGVPPQAIEWQTWLVKNIAFQSLEQFDSDLIALVDEQQQKYRETASALADHGLLLPSEVEASLPELDLEIQDMRGPIAAPIPELSSLPPHVKWYSSP